MKITKKENKSWVTFTFTPQGGATKVELVGEWNEWAPEEMKPKKDGEFYITKVLDNDKSYEYGFRVDGSQWCINEETPCALSPFGSHNSILTL